MGDQYNKGVTGTVPDRHESPALCNLFAIFYIEMKVILNLCREDNLAMNLSNKVIQQTIMSYAIWR